MADFKYTAIDSKGVELSGVYRNVSSVKVLGSELFKLGYSLVNASKYQKDVSRKRKGVKQTEIVEFVYEFAGMYSAGLSVVRSLETIENQTQNDTLRAIVSDIREKVQAGSCCVQMLITTTHRVTTRWRRSTCSRL